MIKASSLTAKERKIYYAIKDAGSRGMGIRDLNKRLEISFKIVSKATFRLLNLKLIRQEWVKPSIPLPGGPLQISKYTRNDFVELEEDSNDEWSKALG